MDSEKCVRGRHTGLHHWEAKHPDFMVENCILPKAEAIEESHDVLG